MCPPQWPRAGLVFDGVQIGRCKMCLLRRYCWIGEWKKKLAFVNGALDQESCDSAILDFLHMQYQLTPDNLLWGKFLPGDSGWLGLRGKEQLVSGSRRRKVRSDSAPRKSQDTFRKHNTRGSASIYSHPPWTPTLPSPIFCGPKLSKSPQEPHCQLSDSWRQKTWVSYRNHLHFQRDFENLDKNYISSIIKFKLSHKHENLF